MSLRQLKLPWHNARHKINSQFRKLVRSAAESDRGYADHMKAVRLLLADVDGTLVTREKVVGALLS